MNFELTTYQKEALNFENHISLTANAGSGKTFVLSERYILIALEKNIPLSRIVAITFTDKAAGELRTKIAEKIRAKIDECADKELLSKLYKIRRQLVSANISTIHAFCTNILREFAVDASIDANFFQIDQNSSSELLELSVNEFLRDSLQNEEIGNDVRQLIRMLKSGEGFAQVLRTIIYKRDVLKQLRNVYSGKTSETADYFKRKYSEILNRIFPDNFTDILSDLAAINSAILNENSENEIARAVEPELASVKSTEDAAKRLMILFDIFERIMTSKKVRTRGYAKKSIRDEVGGLILNVENFYREFSLLMFNCEIDKSFEELSKVGKMLIDSAAKVAEIYEGKKLREGLVDFDDLILKTKEILKREEVRNYLSERFDYIMVDEYQDTNQSQFDIFLPLLDDLKKGNLFVVGDEKQSIYRFRNADLAVFTRTKEIIKTAEKGGFELPLPHTFRLAPNNTLFTNQLSSVWFQSPEPLFNEVADSPMKFASETESPGLVEILLNESDDPKREAELTALRLLKLIAETGIEFNEIAVLCRKRAHFADLEKAFIEHNIPYEIIGGRGFYNQQLVHDVVNYLTFILNPDSDAALIGILRAPFFIVSDAQIFRISKEDGSSFFEKARNFAQTNSEMESIIKILDSHIQKFQRFPLPNLIESIFSETKYYAVIKRRSNGKTILANAEKLISIASTFMQNNFATPSDFVYYLEISMTKADDESQAAPDSGSSTVKVMTIHQAKGLEFKAVFLYKCSSTVKRPRVSTGSVIIDKDLGVIAKIPGSNYFEEYRTPPPAGLYKYIEGRRQTAEEKRLLYVAVTRAKEYLFISASASKNKLPADSFISYIYQGLGADIGSREIPVSGNLECLQIEDNSPSFVPKELSISVPVITEIDVEGVLQDIQVEATSGNQKELLLQTIRDAEKNEFISATKVAVFMQCPLKYKLIYELGYGKLQRIISAIKIPDNFNLKEDEETAGLADVRGSIIHHLLEQEVRPENVLERLELELNSLSGLSSAEKKALKTDIQKILMLYFKSAVFGELCAYTDYRNEFEIYRFVADFYLYGIIDKLIFDGEKCIILDYKTDRISSGKITAKIEHYKNQLLFYAFIIHNMYPEKEIELRLIFLNLPDEKVSIPVDATTLENYKNSLFESISRIRSAEFSPDLTHCAQCHFSDWRNKCVHPV